MILLQGITSNLVICTENALMSNESELNANNRSDVCVNHQETSAGLQKILQEIQPRDTNDFFSDARELETSSGGDQDLQSAATERPSLSAGQERNPPSISFSKLA